MSAGQRFLSVGALMHVSPDLLIFQCEAPFWDFLQSFSLISNGTLKLTQPQLFVFLKVRWSLDALSN